MRYLSALQARNIVKQCSISQQQIFQELLRGVQIKIQIVASLQQFELCWQCPSMLETLPVYDPAFYRDKIAQHLHRYGYYVQSFEPNALYISWRYEQKNPKQNSTVPSKHTHKDRRRQRQTPVSINTRWSARRTRKKPWQQQCSNMWKHHATQNVLSGE